VRGRAEFEPSPAPEAGGWARSRSRTSSRTSRTRAIGPERGPGWISRVRLACDCARLHQGRLKLDEPYDAPEGTEVDLAIVDDGDELDEDERKRLHAAIARSHEEAQRGEVIPADEVLAKLRRG